MSVSGQKSPWGTGTSPVRQAITAINGTFLPVLLVALSLGLTTDGVAGGATASLEPAPLQSTVDWIPRAWVANLRAGGSVLTATQEVSLRTNVITYVDPSRTLVTTSLITSVTNLSLRCPLVFGSENSQFLGIVGRGYFVLRDPENDSLFATRDGACMTLSESSSYLVCRGLRVQGFSDAALTSMGDLRIDSTGRPSSLPPTASIEAINFDNRGRIWISWSGGTQSVRAQILFQDFKYPSKLSLEGPGLWRITEAAGPLLVPLPPATSGLGTVAVGEAHYELSAPVLTLNELHGSAPGVEHGLIYPTGNPTDLAIRGEGFFVVREPNTSIPRATRFGSFHKGSDGFLVTSNGFRLQGFNNHELSSVGGIGALVSDWPGEPRPASTVLDSYQVRADGEIWAQPPSNRSQHTSYPGASCLPARSPQSWVVTSDYIR